MSSGPRNELGSLSGSGGVVSWASISGGDEVEHVPALQWPNSVTTYQRMLNDAQINSLYLGATLPIRSYRWYIDPNGSSAAARIARDYNLPLGSDAAEFYRRRSTNRFSFVKHLEDALRALVYGHYYFEQVGEIGADGGWHLVKLGVRAPRTISEIKTTAQGDLDYIRQLAGPLTPPIPGDRLATYVWDREGANWVGRSMLRAIYRNHVVKDRVLRVGAINIERAGGIPYIEAPDGATGPQMRDLDRLAREFRVGEGAGAALPHGAQLKFASAAGGDGAINYIKLQNEEMARSWLQMFQVLGQTQTGSYALGQSMIDYFGLAQETIAHWVCDEFNALIERDVDWNEGPDEEYAPLLAFDTSHAPNPESGLAAALNHPDGLQVNPSGDVAAWIGAKTSRRRSAPARDGQRVAAGVEVGASSPIPLPSRPLRRQPYEHEIRASVDYAAIDSTYNGARDLLIQEVRQLQAHQFDEIHDNIVEIGDDLEKLAELEVTPIHADVIAARLEQAADIAIGQAVAEANRQGVEVPRQTVSDLKAALLRRAEATDRLLANNLAQTASRNALRLTGGGLDSTAVADEVRTYLRGLTGSYLQDILGGAVQQAMNAGRKIVFQRDGQPGDIYASELLDSNTCGPCTDIDGTPYNSVDDAEMDYPTGGYMDCEGRERCRGTLVKVYTTEAPATSAEPFAS